MFDAFSRLTTADKKIAEHYIGNLDRPPDFVNGPHGVPYLYRWFLAPQSDRGNSFFHMLVGSDPESSLHYHSWENMSVVLAGGYHEYIQESPPSGTIRHYARQAGNVVYRPITHAHRLILPFPGTYALTLFTTGPKMQDWGYLLAGQKVSHKNLMTVAGGRLVNIA